MNFRRLWQRSRTTARMAGITALLACVSGLTACGSGASTAPAADAKVADGAASDGASIDAAAEVSATIDTQPPKDYPLAFVGLVTGPTAVIDLKIGRAHV